LNSQTGNASVSLRVTDQGGKSVIQDFVIQVQPVNDEPVITSTPVTSATEDQPYSYLITATDEETLPQDLKFNLIAGPSWLALELKNDGTAELKGIPNGNNIGDFPVTVQVQDGNNGNINQSFTIKVSDINDVPSFTTQPVTQATEDQEYTYLVGASDEETPAADLNFSLIIKPEWLSITDLNNGTARIQGIPNNNQTGPNEVTIQVTDGENISNTQNFSIQVAAINDQPEFTSNPVLTATEDITYNYLIGVKDEESPLSELVVTIENNRGWLSIVKNQQGQFVLTGTPTKDNLGPHNVKLIVKDPGNNTRDQSFTITVAPVNDLPQFNSQPITTTNEDQEYRYRVEASDEETPSGSLQYTLVLKPAWLNLVNNNDGTVSLVGTPRNIHVGSEDNKVTIRVTDQDDGTRDQSFNILVNPVNDRPFFTSTPILDALEDTRYVYDVGASDEETPGAGLDFSLTQKPEWLSLTDNGNGTARLTGTPNNNQTGNFPVVILVKDQNGAEQTQSFTITVAPNNDRPVITSTPILSAVEDQRYTYNITATDEETSAGNLIFSIPVKPAWLNLGPNNNGTATLSGTPANESTGPIQVVVRVSDGQRFTDQTFTIMVEEVNDAPEFLSNASRNATEDQVYTYSITYDDEDSPLETIILTAETLPSWLTLTNNGDGTATLTGRPNQNNIGQNPVTLRVSDGSKSNDQSFSINVLFINDPPVITSNPVLTVQEDADYIYNFQATDEETEVLITPDEIPTWLTFTNLGDGKASLTGRTTNREVGNHNVKISVTDGTTNIPQNFTINVINVNDDPVFLSSPIRKAIRGDEYTYNIITNDIDQGDQATISIISKPDWLNFSIIGSGTARLSGTPTQLGSYNVEIKAEDRNGGSKLQQFTISVVIVNNLPLFASNPPREVNQDQQYVYNVRIDDPDAGDSHLITGNLLPEWLTLTDAGNSTASLTGIPGAGDVGLHQVQLEVRDAAGGTRQQNFTIRVININDKPIFTSEPSISVRLGDLYSYTILTADPDANDSRRISAPGLPEWLSITTNQDGTATLSGTPGNEQLGEHKITLVVTDSFGEESRQEFTILVSPQNRPPAFSSDPVLTAQEGILYQYEVVVTDPDENDVLTVTAISLPGWLNFNNRGNSTALLSGTPVLEDLGNHNIILEVTDQLGQKVRQTFTITVQRNNRPPRIVSEPVILAEEDEPYRYEIRVQDPDISDQITLTIEELPSWLSFNDQGNGTAILSGTPKFSDLGSYIVEVIARDQAGAQDLQRFELEVQNVNDPPVFESEPVLIAEVNNNYLYNILVTDQDFNDSLTIIAEGLPAWLTFTDYGDGTGLLAGLPGSGNGGSFTIRLIAIDKSGLEDAQEFIISVNNVPSIVSNNLTLTEDQKLVFKLVDFSGVFTDLDGDQITRVRIESLPQHGELILMNNSVLLNSEIDAVSLKFLEYIPDENYSGSDEFSWNGSDGNSYARQPARMNLNITPVNDRPVLTNLESEVARYVFKKDLQMPVSENISIEDPDDQFMQRARVFIQQNFQPEEDELLFDLTGQIEGSYNLDAGILILSGQDTKANYEQVLQSIRYRNNNLENPSFDPRIISFSIDDGDSESALVKRELEIVDELVDVVIPTAFTPDNDGVNDTWELEYIELYPEAEIRIFTRWGEQVFESRGYSNPWNGFYNGDLLTAGVYYYVIKLNNFGDVYKGTVTLIK
jgi:gliding motility-associated-like protein